MTQLPSIETCHAAQQLIGEEALHLDTQRWDEWLALYTADATFWLPAWTDEHRTSASPDTELSLIWCGRAGLEERVWRARSGLSAASEPLPRTTHLVANPVFGAADEGLRVSSSWTCHVYPLKTREPLVFFGRYEHLLVSEAGFWRIRHKKVVLMNDLIPTMLDFYCV